MEKVKPSILVVDDSLTVRMDLQEAFESAGFQVALCQTAAETRTALAGQRFSLVVLDIILPDGDGIDLLGEIKSASVTATVPVMLLTTEVEVRDRVRGLKTGADDYVGKPYDRAHVVARARQLVGAADIPPAQHAPTLLLIDDSATFREEFKTVLESAGYSVRTAGTGEDGLSAAAAVRPHLIIVDRMLPGIDGATVIQRLRQDIAFRNTPCVLLTAADAPGDESRTLDAGADAYLRKDEDVHIILARIDALLRSGVTGSSGDPGARNLLAPKKVLAVDDSPTYLHVLAEELRSESYEVIAASSGREALQLLEVQTVDCILMDLRTPDLSGQETCQIIKRRPEWRNIPLVILTSVEESQAMVEGMNAGADDYIPKSTDFEVLRARVRAQLRRKQIEDEYRSIHKELVQKQVEAAEAKASQVIAEARAAMVDELEGKNRELEAFTYSVSHDLRAPLRSIDGFSKILAEECGDQLTSKAQHYLGRVVTAARRMGELIEALLQLAGIDRAVLTRQSIDLSRLARTIAGELAQSDPERGVEFVIEEDARADADRALMRSVLENLLGNAWKFTCHVPAPKIEMGTLRQNNGLVYFVRDNGAGFDPAHADKLFAPFQRLHSEAAFPGTGIGLATVQRIIDRHGGRVWAQSAVGQGATFFFTLGAASNGDGASLKPSR
jgi:two-component system NtrC family sensor kinase